jgi:hypothetical protein
MYLFSVYFKRKFKKGLQVKFILKNKNYNYIQFIFIKLF